jgi:hypothetical protein
MHVTVSCRLATETLLRDEWPAGGWAPLARPAQELRVRLDARGRVNCGSEKL